MLLNSGEFSSALYRALDEKPEKLVIFSAFVKIDALNYICKKFSLNDTSNVLIVARWQKKDLLAGASDAAVYEFCKNKGWSFGVSFQMHGKIFVIDDNEIFLGSANLTRKGLHIGLIGNHEFGTKISAASADLEKLDRFIESEVRVMDDKLFLLISEDLEASQLINEGILSTTWTEQVMREIDRPVSYLWVAELLKTTPDKILSLDIYDDSVVADCELLGLDFDSVSPEKLKNSFQMSRACRWLVELLKNSGTLHFGGVTKALHDSLLDDPKPFRIEVKDAVVNLYAWAKFIDDTFEVTQPNRSELISLR